MKNTLRDQLLKAGFADKKQAKKVEAERRQQAHKARKARKSGGPVEPTARELAAQEARLQREEEARKSRERNRAREEERERKALRAQLKQQIDVSSRPHGKGDIRYHFVEKKKIRRLYIDADLQSGLMEGRLAIVTWEGLHYVVPTGVAQTVRERAPNTFVFIAEPEEVDPEDPYADYPIPDDLEW